jgi:ubiquinone/menaquinone biosynthesis C-methylase UbiE
LSSKNNLTLLNLGCGSTFHSSWKNLDVNPLSEEIEYWDAKQGVPFKSGSVDFVYHSHLLEHLAKEDGKLLLEECFRVLKSKGILRVVVPDLEGICKAYLSAISRIDKGDDSAKMDAEWMRLELYDQTTRKTSGGLMLEFLQSNPSNKDFIIERCGQQVSPHLKQALLESDSKESLSNTIPIHLRIKMSIKKMLQRSFWKNWLSLKFLGNEDYQALTNGRFWNSGEIHKQMYDRFSLKQLLTQIGFRTISIKSANESDITGWADFFLDFTQTGIPRKPDSLYLEAIKS